MLQARSLSVEVGGRLTLADASFSMRAGDKVGLVGRNGVGKTSLLKVLAGEADAAGGVVLRPEATGYLPQDPRPAGAGVDATGLSHVLSGRGLDAAAHRLEELRVRVDGGALRPQRRPLRARRGGRSATPAGTPPSRRSGASRPASVCRATASTSRSTALSGGERRRVELARILFAGSELLLLDEPTNHLDTDAKEWLLGFLRSYRGALLVVSHDLDLLDEAITRVLHLDDGELVEYRGTYSQYRTARAADEERLRREVAQQQARRSSGSSSLADAMRGQTVKRARTAKALDTRVARLRRDAVDRPAREKRISVRFPEPPRPGAVVLARRRAHEGLRRASRVQRRDVRRRPGRAPARHGPQRRRQDEPDAPPGRPDRSRRRNRTHRARRRPSGTTRRSTRASSPGARSWTTCATQVAAARPGLRNLLGTFGLSRRDRVPGRGHAVGRREDRSSRSRSSSRVSTTLLLLDEPTNNLDPPSRDAIGAALRSWPGAIVLVSHDAEFVARLQPDRVLLMPEGDLDYWSDDLLDLVALA